jgi:hypothetical protein
MWQYKRGYAAALGRDQNPVGSDAGPDLFGIIADHGVVEGVSLPKTLSGGIRRNYGIGASSPAMVTILRLTNVWAATRLKMV